MTTVTTLPSGWSALFWGILTFSLLVMAHEGGHFLAARAFGVKVHEFMLGLPGPALRWRSKRTGVVYGVTAIPLGGYVRIAGMEPGAEDDLLGSALGLLADRGELDANALAAALTVPLERASALLVTLADYCAGEEVDVSTRVRALVTRAPGESDADLLARVRSQVYRGQPVWKRITILAMGVLVNIVGAILILTLALSILGVPTPTPTIAQVAAGSAAAQAGLRSGDTIIGLGSTHITGWERLISTLDVAHAGQTVTVEVLRSGQTLRLPVTLRARSGGGALLGVTASLRNIPMTPGAAARQALSMTGAVFVAIGRFFSPRTFASSVAGSRSVVGISYEVARAASEGPLAYAWMVSLLSLSLGVMNLLPIPPLDGGKIAVELLQRATSRHLPRWVSIATSAVGTALLFSLIFYLMYADVMRYVVGKS